MEISQSNAELDLVLLDLNLPDNHDFSLLKQIRQTLPSTPIAMLSTTEDAALFQEALQLGAHGFIPKSSNSQIMLQAAQLILAGGLYLPPQIMMNAGSATAPTPSVVARNIANSDSSSSNV